MTLRTCSATMLCATLAIGATTFLHQRTAVASTHVSESEEVHNGDDDERSAIKLTFRVHVPEDESEDYWMESYSAYLQPSVFSTVSVTNTYENSHGEVWAFDVMCEGGTVDYCTEFKIHAEVELNKWNTLYIRNVTLYYQEKDRSPEAKKVVPDHGFYFGNVLYHGNLHRTSYTFHNSDPDNSITVNYLRFYSDVVWYDPANQWNGIGTLLKEVSGPFVLASGSSYTVPLEDLPYLPDSFIYVAGEVQYSMTGFPPETLQFRHGHEEEELLAGGAPVPTLTEWGLIVLVLLMVGASIVVIRQRRVVVQ